MNKFLLPVCAVLALCFATSALAEPLIPDYSKWDCMQGGSTDPISTSACFKDVDLPTSIVITYSKRDTAELQLLIFVESELYEKEIDVQGILVPSIYTKKVTIHLFRQQNGKWISVETRALHPEDGAFSQPIFFFALNSPFGQEFLNLFPEAKKGEAPEYIPSMSLRN